jgi:hypothetical protein
VRRVAVIALERGAALEIAGEREIDRATPAREAAPHLDAQQPRDPAALRFERAANVVEAAVRAGLQAPQDDMADHETRIVAG